jgi:hypothetical protein
MQQLFELIPNFPPPRNFRWFAEVLIIGALFLLWGLWGWRRKGWRRFPPFRVLLGVFLCIISPLLITSKEIRYDMMSTYCSVGPDKPWNQFDPQVRHVRVWFNGLYYRFWVPVSPKDVFEELRKQYPYSQVDGNTLTIWVGDQPYSVLYIGNGQFALAGAYCPWPSETSDFWVLRDYTPPPPSLPAPSASASTSSKTPTSLVLF